jgi:hypothetical protein
MHTFSSHIGSPIKLVFVYSESIHPTLTFVAVAKRCSSEVNMFSWSLLLGRNKLECLLLASPFNILQLSLEQATYERIYSGRLLSNPHNIGQDPIL